MFRRLVVTCSSILVSAIAPSRAGVAESVDVLLSGTVPVQAIFSHVLQR